ncbi:ephrin-B2a-like [Coccinella septempunctata]|uniref:ephrin-B2a-like n=1 Tax=Coccinella septempunctata TaxID=41139 RepID=UPI001D06AA5A|nr:ephrin-B2a-like [Coccinella septempunctata]
MALVRKCTFFNCFVSTTSSLSLVLFVCLNVLLFSHPSSARSFHVHWNTTNSIFRIDNTDHIIDVNKGNVQFEYDQVNIICPVYMPGTYDEDAEKYIIYNVTKEEYETCRITNPDPKIIAICDKPYKLMYFTITFRPFTPQPGGLEFQPGKDYYFISTSSGDDLHRRVGGRCLSDNMKIVFKVCCAENQTSTTSTTRFMMPSTPFSWPTRPTPGPTTTTTTPWSPRIDHIPSRKPPKKSNEYDKHPNEVVKNEELTYNTGVWLSAAPSSILVLVALIACLKWR